MSAQRLVAIATGLISDDNDNPEYDRAVSEVVAEYLGFSTEFKTEIHNLLIAKKSWS